MLSTDFVIVGGASAGATLAGRLSEDPSVSVLLLEAGGNARSPWIDWPLGLFKTIGNADYDWKFQTEPAEQVAGRRVNWPRGKGCRACRSDDQGGLGSLTAATTTSVPATS